jgi:hypothetical protein
VVLLLLLQQQLLRLSVMEVLPVLTIVGGACCGGLVSSGGGGCDTIRPSFLALCGLALEIILGPAGCSTTRSAPVCRLACLLLAHSRVR